VSTTTRPTKAPTTTCSGVTVTPSFSQVFLLPIAMRPKKIVAATCATLAFAARGGRSAGP
jgi:hypothetical protein